MLNTIVEDYPSNRLPTSTLNPFKFKYIQHVAIRNQNSSPFHDSLLISNLVQIAQFERHNLITILAFNIIYVCLL